MRSDNISEIVQCKNDDLKQSTLLSRRIALTEQIRSRRKQRGFDLIQLGLVVALIGLLMAGAMVGVPKLIEHIKTNQQLDDVRIFTTQAQAYFALFRDSEVKAEIAGQAGLYPGVHKTDKPLVYPARFGDGEVTIGHEGVRKLSLQITKVPSVAACAKLGSQLIGIDADVKIGTKLITRSEGRLDMAELSKECAATPVVVPPATAATLDITIITKV